MVFSLNKLLVYPRLAVILTMTVFLLIGCLGESDEGSGMEQTNNEINLIIASVNGAMDEVVFYREALGSVNFVSIKGDTPLNAAAANGNLNVVKYLVDQGASFDLKDAYGLTALETAKQKGNLNIVEFLEAKMSESNQKKQAPFIEGTTREKPQKTN